MRYSRQIILPELGTEGQAALQKARVLCIGAGGLGCAALPYLAAAGVGTLGICDDDQVELSNLQRQVLFKTAEAGKPKAELAAAALRGLNPEIGVKVHATRLSPENALALFAEYDIILDGSDNFAAKFLINDAAAKLDKPWVYGAVLGFEGQVSVFHSKHGPCYRCLYGEAPKNPVANCAEAGVLGAFVGVVGALQAVEVLKLAAKRPQLTPLLGKLLMLDARDWQIHEMALASSPSCPICSTKPENIRLTISNNACSTFSASDPSIPEISAEDAVKLKMPFFLDVREPHEWSEGHVRAAKHIPLGTLLSQTAPELPREGDLIVYCRGGTRSKKALQHLRKLGFTNGKNLTGGFVSFSGAHPEQCEA
ncbi:MAG: HesA/MoeB/ThiF family protein [Proteobacteria bacterium]|nr:HesA/MoeB/ThiF family protein [Pseudomonadota bacterium]